MKSVTHKLSGLPSDYQRLVLRQLQEMGNRAVGPHLKVPALGHRRAGQQQGQQTSEQHQSQPAAERIGRGRPIGRGGQAEGISSTSK